MEQMEKKYGKSLVDSYCDSRHNYAADHELTVKITLAEYRELVSSAATKKDEIEKVRSESWKKDEEIKKLQSLVASQQAEIQELKF